jgi:hypothetical protein
MYECEKLALKNSLFHIECEDDTGCIASAPVCSEAGLCVGIQYLIFLSFTHWNTHGTGRRYILYI